MADENSEKRLEGVVEDEFYSGRRIIQRDSPIDKGVYLDAGEAIVVDSEKYPEIQRLYEAAKKKALVGRVENDMLKYLVLNAVYDTVKESMNYDEKAVGRLVAFCHSGKDGKIALDLFIKNHVGDGRHMALACGALLELFKKDGYIGGKASIDRDVSGGRAWCRYTNSGGELYILDVAQGFIGRLEKATNQDYRRPEEGILEQ